MNVQRDFFFLLLICNREGIEEKITTFMRLKQMKNGSAPGCDGITVEFLKMLWARISKLLTLSFNSAIENGNLSSSQRKAVITLKHKGKDLARDKLMNWRPISLTNSDYRLLQNT